MIPGTITTVEQLDDVLTTPSDALIADLAALDGDVMIIGAGGKMGPTLAQLAQRGLDSVGRGQKAIAVARFSDEATKARLEAAGVTTLAMDVSEPDALASLPDVPNIVYMLGMKFGTTGKEYLTWEVNTFISGQVAKRFRDARFTVFSSGNIYPFRPVVTGGATEDVPAAPIGEYAQSCLARERMFEHASMTYGTKVSIFRLNYAIDLRYGVLWDIASQVLAGDTVDITMGNVNVIWQGDANEIALRVLTRADSPPTVWNVTGPETISMRYLVDEFAQRFGVEAKTYGEEAPNALLSNATKAMGEFGYPSVPLARMIDLVAAWVQAGGESLGKPTHFQTRDGKF